MQVNMASLGTFLKCYAQDLDPSSTVTDTAGYLLPAQPQSLPGRPVTTESAKALPSNDAAPVKSAVSGYLSWLVKPKPGVSKRDLNIMAPVST